MASSFFFVFFDSEFRTSTYNRKLERIVTFGGSGRSGEKYSRRGISHRDGFTSRVFGRCCAPVDNAQMTVQHSAQLTGVVTEKVRPRGLPVTRAERSLPVEEK